MKGVPFFNGSYTKRFNFLSEMVWGYSKGLDHRAAPPGIKFCSLPPSDGDANEQSFKLADVNCRYSTTTLQRFLRVYLVFLSNPFTRIRNRCIVCKLNELLPFYIQYFSVRSVRKQTLKTATVQSVERRREALLEHIYCVSIHLL